MYIENNNDNSTQLVESIVVEPATVSLPELYKHQLTATVYPESVVNKEVRWHSENEDVATVNPSTGVVFLKKAGETTTIYATACDGSEVYGTCQVTVLPPIPVQGVHILDGDLTMYQGETKCPYPLIYPGSASNRAVMWCSSDPSVASVGLYTGEVWAVGPGTATITVTTLDGGFTSSITVTVYVDAAVIEKIDIFDEDDADKLKDSYTQITFRNSNKVWKCVGVDLINSGIDGFFRDRGHFNVFENPEACVDIKPYTDAELKLLYAVDPHGVAYYIYRYADEHIYDWSLEEMVEYKDIMFRKLFGREPLYFERSSEDEWCIARYREPLYAVLSESETLFGGHMVWDEYTIEQTIEFAVTMAMLALSAISAIHSAAASVIGDCLRKKAMDFALCASNIAAKVISYGFTMQVRGDILATAANDVIGHYFDEMNLGWAWEFLNTWVSVAQMQEGGFIRSDYERDVCEYLVNNTGYQVVMKLKDGEHTLQDIQSAFEEN